MSRNLTAAARRLEAAAAALPAARRALLEAAPGWPSAGPKGGPGYADTSSTERAALEASRALSDARRLETLARLAITAADMLAELVEIWARPPRRGVAAEDSDAWCRSCRRIRLAVPSERAGLCWWCRHFKAAEGVLPPLELLEARRDGRRVTRAMVDRALGQRPSS